LSKAGIKALVRKKRIETEKRLQITREDILQGLLRAVWEANEAGNPLGIIKVCREIRLMLGYYDQPRVQIHQDICEEQVRAMSDGELQPLIK
jgi:hypothetical protein